MPLRWYIVNFQFSVLQSEAIDSLPGVQLITLVLSIFLAVCCKFMSIYPLVLGLLFQLLNINHLSSFPFSSSKSFIKRNHKFQFIENFKCVVKNLRVVDFSLRDTKDEKSYESSIGGSSSKSGRNKRNRVASNQRQKLFGDDNFAAGRVSVYCVGDHLDLQALRTHVFRRGFGRSQDNLEKPDLVLSRGAIDDEKVLHISNAPLFISTELFKEDPESEYQADKSFDPASSERDNFDDSNEIKLNKQLSEESMIRTRERLLMATQDIFYFDYGVVVFWGLTKMEEKAALTELEPFTTGKVTEFELEDSYDTMEFVFDHKANPQRPIRFDRMKLRTLDIAEKLALSYAMAQSSKLFVFESKILKRLEATRYLPKELAESGKISSSKKDLNMLIGQLFVEQTEVNLFSTILDTPDFLWDDDEHVSTYQYTRSYLEVDDRVSLLNSRLGVIRELLDVLTAQVADSNSKRLEWIVIWLITVEIVLGIASSPLFVGKRVVTAALVPAAILLFKKYAK